jgi:flavin-dependent dehydrogenase
MERRPLVIVGSGPAGSASALFLYARDPALAREAVVLEKAHHPRPKVCAGGLIPQVLRCLEEVGAPLAVPNVVVHRATVQIPGRTVTYEGEELCRVVRRDEFDHSLVRACRERGVEVREGEKVVDIDREGDGIRIETERSSYHARAVIAADGSGSLVRRRLFPRAPECVGRGVMCDVPLAQAQWGGFRASRYEFIFRSIPEGLRGYAWAFPCVIGGVPHVNVGAYCVDAEGSGALLRHILREELARVGAPALPVKAFPVRWYARRVPLAAPRVMLTGDAAGVDPLMGEGISFCFEYGRRAAAAIARAFATSDFTFADYARSVEGSWVGRKLRRLGLGVRLFYGPTWRLWFAIAAHSRTAQEIGIRWYNGVDGWDQRSGWEALHAWWRGDIRPALRQESGI